MGAKAIVEACKMGFFIDFEKYKQMTWAFFPNNSIEVLKTNPSNQNLKAIVDDRVRTFFKISQWLPPATKVHVAIQTDKAGGETSLQAAKDLPETNNALGLQWM